MLGKMKELWRSTFTVLQPMLACCFSFIKARTALQDAVHILMLQLCADMCHLCDCLLLLLLLPLLHPADVFLCHQPETRQRMVEYALDQDFFFSKYTQGFDKMATLGYKQSELFTLGSSAK